MINLFTMYVHALGIANPLVVADFFEHVIFDTIRHREESWQFSHELMLVIFRHIEDSGGRLNLTNAYAEMYLNQLMVEARSNASVFFRTLGGSPGTVIKERGDKLALKWNSKFTTTSKAPCRYFNMGADHPSDALYADGTCKYLHACDHWVSNKGKKGRCLDLGHVRGACTNSHKCDDCVN